MRICITGTPGTGKTTIAKQLGGIINHKVLNEREFALAQGIGEYDTQENELVVPLEKLESRLNKLLAKEKNIIVEGHMLCETKCKFDLVIVLRVHPERLAARLELRGYKDEKIQDNVFVEGIDYCKKHALRNYAKSMVLEAENKQTIKETTALLLNEIASRDKRIIAKPLPKKRKKQKK